MLPMTLFFRNNDVNFLISRFLQQNYEEVIGPTNIIIKKDGEVNEIWVCDAMGIGHHIPNFSNQIENVVEKRHNSGSLM